MFENMNPLDKSTAWLEIFLLMFGAFLIGYFFARWFYKLKLQRELDECEEENKKLNLQSLEHANSTFPSGIKAVQTRDRKGELINQIQEDDNKEKVEEFEVDGFDETEEKITLRTDNSGLNFESFGTANEADKDDLKLISGVGPFIEKKLNGIGVYTFSQVSKFRKQDIEDVTELIKFFPGRIDRDDWVGQAKKLMK